MRVSRLLLRRAARTLRGTVGVLARPPAAPPGHYYSPLTSAEDAARAVAWSETDTLPEGIAFEAEAVEALGAALAPHWTGLEVGRRYQPDDMYVKSDAAIYHSMIAHHRPARIVEIGSGYSTAVALDTIDTLQLSTSVHCIEPYPERLYSLLQYRDEVTIDVCGVQDCSPDLFTALSPGDILFIDSSHVAKSGSDVVWLIQRILPRLSVGVIVHIHDVFWPFEYPRSWLDERRDWNELYMLGAFLSGNDSWRISLFNDWLWKARVDLVEEFLPDTLGQRPGGLWLTKTA